MKKVLAVLMAMMLCLGMTAAAWAEVVPPEAENCEAVIVSEEALATIEKDAAESEGDASKSNSSLAGELIRFIPAYIEASTNKLTVYGFFFNMNTDVAVGGFRNYKMDIYYGNQLIASGDFGTINDFTIEPLGLRYQSFTYNGKHRLKNGTAVCGDKTYSVTSYKFYTYSR